MLYRNYIKVVLDFSLAVVLFLILSPILIATCVILLISNQGTPFFFQPRVGKGNRIFTVMKFKTMNDRKDQHGNLLTDDERLTTIGKFVRSSSLDELPQIMNILRGDMSFVGPRPLLIEYLPLYSHEQRRRHDVTPGITGWAQVHGRNAISWKEKFRYDVWYVDHIGFWLDLKILFMTVGKVVKAEGISGVGVATVEKFNGSN